MKSFGNFDLPVDESLGRFPPCLNKGPLELFPLSMVLLVLYNEKSPFTYQTLCAEFLELYFILELFCNIRKLMF